LGAEVGTEEMTVEEREREEEMLKCAKRKARGLLWVEPKRVNLGALARALRDEVLNSVPIVSQPRHALIDSSNPLVRHGRRSSSPFEPLLPASYRSRKGNIKIATANLEHLKRDLGVERLNKIHDYLWLAGRAMPPRPLNYQVKSSDPRPLIYRYSKLELNKSRAKMI
jgi:hypothetical protein